MSVIVNIRNIDRMIKEMLPPYTVWCRSLPLIVRLIGL